MSETPQPKEVNPADRRWSDAIEQADMFVKSQGVNMTLEQEGKVTEALKLKLEELGAANKLKFVETEVEGQSVRTIELPGSESHADGLPVEDVMSLLGASESHVFAVSDTSEPWYLQGIADFTGKPVEAYAQGQPVSLVEPRAA